MAPKALVSGLAAVWSSATPSMSEMDARHALSTYAPRKTSLAPRYNIFLRKHVIPQYVNLR